MRLLSTRNAFAALAAFALTCGANALTITWNPVAPYSPAVLFGDHNDVPGMLAAVNAVYPDAVEVYKKNSNGSEDFTFKDNYEGTVGTNGGSIVHDAGDPFITGSQIFFLIKDGNASPNWFLYDISGWNGTDTIEFNGFFPTHSISHVSILAGGSGDFRVPDGGSTVALLGLGLGLLAFARRKLA